MNLEGLNNEQLKAVKHNNGPLLILAGAGSGKTKVLTMRVANLINEYNVKPSEILAITFTNKAANEMKERIHNVLGSVADNVRICTFHSFGLFILRREYEYIGYERNFTIIDSEDSFVQGIKSNGTKVLNLDVELPSALLQRNDDSQYIFLITSFGILNLHLLYPLSTIVKYPK